MLVAPTTLVAATSSDDLAAARRQAQSWRSPEIGIADRDLTDAALDDLIATAQAASEDSFARAVTAIAAARAGRFPVIPHIEAAGEIFRSFLRHDLSLIHISEPTRPY